LGLARYRRPERTEIQTAGPADRMAGGDR